MDDKWIKKLFLDRIFNIKMDNMNHFLIGIRFGITLVLLEYTFYSHFIIDRVIN